MKRFGPLIPVFEQVGKDVCVKAGVVATYWSNAEVEKRIISEVETEMLTADGELRLVAHVQRRKARANRGSHRVLHPPGGAAAAAMPTGRSPNNGIEFISTRLT